MQSQSAISSEKVIVMTTTFYEDLEGKDKVRFNLVCKLVEFAINDGHIVVIVDASPVSKVKERLQEIGAYVYIQSEKGMGSGRRQAGKEARKFITPDVAAVLWTEEKPDIIRFIGNMVACLRERNARAVILSRSSSSWETYPGFQRESEQTANIVYNNLFPSDEGLFDPMFGPLCLHPDELTYLTEMDPKALGLPDTYIQHYVPIIMRSRGLRVSSIDVDFIYPPEQLVEEATVKTTEMIEKRLWQLKQLVTAYFNLHQRFSLIS